MLSICKSSKLLHHFSVNKFIFKSIFLLTVNVPSFYECLFSLWLSLQYIAVPSLRDCSFTLWPFLLTKYTTSPCLLCGNLTLALSQGNRQNTFKGLTEPTYKPQMLQKLNFPNVCNQIIWKYFLKSTRYLNRSNFVKLLTSLARDRKLSDYERLGYSPGLLRLWHLWKNFQFSC